MLIKCHNVLWAYLKGNAESSKKMCDPFKRKLTMILRNGAAPSSGAYFSDYQISGVRVYLIF